MSTWITSAVQVVLHSLAIGRTLNPAFSIHVPVTSPANAAGPIDPTFQSFAFETASFAQYAQTSPTDPTPNQFSLTLMEEIMSRTGGYPIIRIGGTSADYAHFDPGLEDYIYPIAEYDGLQLVNFTLVGPNFYNLTKNFASLNPKFTLQFPMGTNNISETVAWAKAAIPLAGWENVEAIELGNEPNYWGPGPRSRYVNESDPTGYSNGPILGPPAWKGFPTNETFAADTHGVIEAIIDQLPVPDSHLPIFQPGGIGQDRPNITQNFDIQKIFKAGINKGGQIKNVAGHYYSTEGEDISSSNLGSILLNHTLLVDGMRWATRFIDYLHGTPEGADGPLPFDMNEVGNSVDNPRDREFQCSLGSALWQVDFQLYCASIGVRRINWHHIMRAAFGLWLPRESDGQPAQTYSNLYAMFLVGDFIGKGGKTKISQVDISGDIDREKTVAYMAHEDETPRRLAIINFEEWPKVHADTEGHGGRWLRKGTTRGGPVYVIDGLPKGWATVKRLNSPEGVLADASSMTYGGSQWTYESGGREVRGVRDDTERVWVGDDGTAEIKVWDSSAVLVSFGEERPY